MTASFGGFVLDVPQRLLRRGSQVVHLPPKAFDVLTLLVAERPRAVPKDEILATVWRDVFVTESTLSTAVRDIRRALDDDADEPQFIRTAYAFGYAFMADVDASESRDRAVTSPPPAWRLVLEGASFDLVDGANVVGRDAAGATGVIVIDAPTISRRHACLRVTPEGVTCEDLGSKNGTWHGTTPVTTPVLVADGDEIRLGAVVAVLRRQLATSTETMTRRAGP